VLEDVAQNLELNYGWKRRPVANNIFESSGQSIIHPSNISSSTLLANNCSKISLEQLAWGQDSLVSFNRSAGAYDVIIASDVLYPGQPDNFAPDFFNMTRSLLRSFPSNVARMSSTSQVPPPLLCLAFAVRPLKNLPLRVLVAAHQVGDF
jgi:hypothetical protein